MPIWYFYGYTQKLHIMFFKRRVFDGVFLNRRSCPEIEYQEEEG